MGKGKNNKLRKRTRVVDKPTHWKEKPPDENMEETLQFLVYPPNKMIVSNPTTDLKDKPNDSEGKLKPKIKAQQTGEFANLKELDHKSKPPDINDRLKLLSLFTDKLTSKVKVILSQWNTYSIFRRKKNDDNTWVYNDQEIYDIFEMGRSNLQEGYELLEKALEIKEEIAKGGYFKAGQRMQLQKLEISLTSQTNNMNTTKKLV